MNNQKHIELVQSIMKELSKVETREQLLDPMIALAFLLNKEEFVNPAKVQIFVMIVTTFMAAYTQEPQVDDPEIIAGRMNQSFEGLIQELKGNIQ